MAALPLYILILGAQALDLPSEHTGDVAWIEVICGEDRVIQYRDSFVWDSLARFMISDAVDSGYAFASLSVARSELKGDTLMLYTKIDKGPLVRIASLAFSGDRKTRTSLLAHLVRFEPFIYSTTEVAELVDDLGDLGCTVLDWEILIAPLENRVFERGLPMDDTINSAATLHFLINEVSSPNRVTALLGYGDEEGFVGMADLWLSNLFGGRREFFFSWQRLAPNNVNFALSARDPYPFRLPFGIEGAGAFRSFDETTYHLEASAGVFIVPSFFELGLGYAYEQDRSGSTRISKNLASTRLSAGALDVNIRAGERWAKERAVYLKASANAGILFPLVWGFSFWLEPNAAVVTSADSLLETELIPLGGARTLRGYVEEEFRTGLAAWSRQELRWGSESFSLYPLFDVALIEVAGFAAGYGAGIAIATPIGRLELDAALPWEGAWHDAKLHLSVGAEF
jgi:outer membrane protein assembly factor BamA